MAKDVKQKVSRIKVKKKNWYRILSSRIFGEKEIGETYLSSPESALGRTMKINLKDLTGNIKDQKIYISFTIDKVEGSILRTSATGYELTPTSVKRMVRKSTDRLDDYYGHALEMIDRGHAYVCECSAEEFKALSVKKEECPAWSAEN